MAFLGADSAMAVVSFEAVRMARLNSATAVGPSCGERASTYGGGSGTGMTVT